MKTHEVTVSALIKARATFALDSVITLHSGFEAQYVTPNARRAINQAIPQIKKTRLAVVMRVCDGINFAVVLGGELYAKVMPIGTV